MIGLLAAVEAVATANDAMRSALGDVTAPPSADDRAMPIYSQTDPHWANDPIGTTTIGRFGCLITCWAMILSKIEGRDVLPNEVAERIKSHCLLQLNGGVLYADLPQITVVPLKTWEKTGGDSAELFERANSADRINSFGVIGMRINEWPGTHYVLSIGNGEIINPMGGVVQRVSDGTKSGGIFAAAVWSLL